jgi:HK97 family phage prohead protease
LDQSVRDKSQGLSYEYIESPPGKSRGNEHSELSPAARKEMQDEVSRVCVMFCQSVARARKLNVGAIYDTGAAVLFGPRAVPTFADRCGVGDDAMAWMRAALPSTPSYSIGAPGDKEGWPASDPPQAHLPHLPRSLPAPTSGLHISSGIASDATQWLRMHGNLGAHAGALTPAVESMRACEPAMSARYGRQIQARIVQHPRAKSSATGTGTGTGKQSRIVQMLVAPYNAPTYLGDGVWESYAPGCFAQGLGNDPAALWQHLDQYVIGRASARTARFWESADGLHCEAAGPDAVWFSDLLASVARGDIAGASAAFWIVAWHPVTDGGRQVRMIDRAVLRDASVVSFPAYTGTSAELAPAGTGANATHARQQKHAALERIDQRAMRESLSPAERLALIPLD